MKNSVTRELDESDPSFQYSGQVDYKELGLKRVKYQLQRRYMEEQVKEIVNGLPGFILPSVIPQKSLAAAPGRLQMLTAEGPRLPLPLNVHPVYTSNVHGMNALGITPDAERVSRGVLLNALQNPVSAGFLATQHQVDNLRRSVGAKKKVISRSIREKVRARMGGKLAANQKLQAILPEEQKLEDVSQVFALLLKRSEIAGLGVLDEIPRSVQAEDPACTSCKANYELKAKEMRELGPESLINNLTPVCEKYWPYISELIGGHLCDPLVPGECEFLCKGMLKTWSTSMSDILSIALADPGYHCHYTEKVCPRDSSVDKSVFPSTIINETGKSSGVVRILQLSDIHLDDRYEDGQEADCGLPICCRKEGYVQPTTIKRKAQPMGDFKCDAPMPLFRSVLEEVGRHKEASHVLFTGDAPAHDLWEQTQQGNLNTVLKVSNLTAQALAAHQRYWPVLGNHAAAPVNHFGGPAKDLWINAPIAAAWGPHLCAGATETLAWGGYYTCPMEPGVHLVALQSNYYDSNNLYLKWGVGHWDMAGQFGWLESVLEQITLLGEKALIIMHEKPKSFSTGIWPLKWQQLMETYGHKTVIAIIAGHNHNDMVHVQHRRAGFMPTFEGQNVVAEVVNNDYSWQESKKIEVNQAKADLLHNSVPVTVEYIASSLTPVDHSTNPTYRIYSLDLASQTIADYDQYYLDLEQANLRGGGQWQLLYSARNEYDLPDLSAKAWHDLGLKMINNRTLYEKYNYNYCAGHMQGSKNYTNVGAACGILSHLIDEEEECWKQLGSYNIP